VLPVATRRWVSDANTYDFRAIFVAAAIDNTPM
jgi:hypothetical protein